MKEELRLSNLIFNSMKYIRMNIKDLEFSMNCFVEREMYEKCSVIKEIIENKYCDSKRTPLLEVYSKITKNKKDVKTNISFLKEELKSDLSKKERNRFESQLETMKDLLKSYKKTEKNFWKIEDTLIKKWEKEGMSFKLPLTGKNKDFINM